jgi:TolA-binding protein
MSINKLLIASLSILALVNAACKSPKEKLVQEITNTEAMLFADSASNMNRATVEKVVDYYTTFANKFPDDSLAPEYLFKAGDVSSGTASYTRSLGYFNEVYTKYPNHNKAAASLFLMGYINENSLNDTAAARKYYTEFLNKFPNNEMAQSAQFSLSNLGKSPEELVKLFNLPDSTAAK